MSTRSTITSKTKDGKYRSIYCHFDGYVEDGVGEMLFKHYNTQEKIDALLDLGHLSSLYESIECPKGHSFDNRRRGYTVAYRRDRGDTECDARIYNDLKDIDAQEYHYIWDRKEWTVVSRYEGTYKLKQHFIREKLKKL